MKKIVYSLIIVVSVFSLKSNAQSFSTANAVNYLQGSASTPEFIGTVDVWNNSATDKDVMMYRQINNLATGHESFFCWDLCFPPFVDTSGTFVTIPANNFVSNAIADLKTYGFAGISHVTYCWYDFNNPSDQICLEFIYDITTGINEIANSKADFLSLPHPNPADANTVILFHLKNREADARILFYNVIGKKVLETKINDATESVQINTSSFQEGVYYYSLVSGSKVISTNKLIVSHKN